jgi:hypothetical protein
MASIRALIHIVIAVALSLGICGVFLYKLKQQIPTPIAVVDLLDVTNEASERILKGAGSIEDKGKASTDFAIKLSSEVQAIADECRCTLVNRAAILSKNPVDYTERLKRAMR